MSDAKTLAQPMQDLEHEHAMMEQPKVKSVSEMLALTPIAVSTIAVPCSYSTKARGQSSEVSSFSDLPRELRDTIHELVLVQELPIELAPLSGIGYDKFWDGAHMNDDYGQGYHIKRYKDDIRPNLGLLRVNKQLNDEAAPIYYGQPFRFSNQTGWTMLYHWLEYIGERNRTLVIDITICHPSRDDMPPTYWQADMIFERALLMQLGIRHLFRESDGHGRSHTEEYTTPNFDSAKMVARMPALRSLGLILWYASALNTLTLHPYPVGPPSRLIRSTLSVRLR